MVNSFFNPYGNNAQFGISPFSQPMAQPPAQQLIKVSGLEGAKAFQMGPNSAVALFHESEDILYVKTTDGAGFPSIRTFRFTPYEEAPAVEVEKYVTIDEFEKFKRELFKKEGSNGKQSVRQ